ncbi:MAG TPA: hypothetical protein VKV28_12820 [Candidatus Binataceae bacterium]|nr:hypothetical protein [Candidatus Binataceae bacterium]
MAVSAERQGLGRLMARVHTDRAGLFGVANVGTRMMCAALTAALVALCFSPELQGYYYTFASLLGLQVMAEMGFGQVVIQFAAHEWAHLRMTCGGVPAGEPAALSRLISLGRLAIAWYALAAIISSGGLIVAGLAFFPAASKISWRTPWIALGLVSGASLATAPMWLLLEGCNQVTEVYRFRLTESVLSGLGALVAIALGAGLWTPALAVTTKLFWNVAFLRRRYRKFFRCFIFQPSGPRTNWRYEIWPLQWRIALSWLSGYLAFNSLTPVLFHYRGPVIAGQTGMTLSLVVGVQQIAAAWALVKAPAMGVSIARRDYRAADRLAGRLIVSCTALSALAAGAAWLAICGLYAYRIPWAYRLLPPPTSGLFLLACIPAQAAFPLSVYLRAHKREPLMVPSLLAGLLIFASACYLSRAHGAGAIAASYMAITGVAAPLAIGTIWLRARRRWHRLPSPAAQLSSPLSASLRVGR